MRQSRSSAGIRPRAPTTPLLKPFFATGNSGRFKEQTGSAEVVKMVAGDKYAIGYSGIGYLTAGVRTVPLAVAPGDKCYDTSPASTSRGIILLHAISTFISIRRRPSLSTRHCWNSSNISCRGLGRLKRSRAAFIRSLA